MLNRLFLKQLAKGLLLLMGGLLNLKVMGLPVSKKAEQTSSLSYCQNCRFETLKEEIEKRSHLILKDVHFQPWQSTKQDEQIKKEFESLEEWRKKRWYHNPTAKIRRSQDLFIMAKDLQTAKYFHYPEIVAFQYNRSDPTYNASTIMLNGRCFFALEAPTAESEQRFLKFLHRHHVTHLVRLTPSHEKGIEKCYPYWQGRLHLNKNNFEGKKDRKSEKDQKPSNHVLKFPVNFPGKKRVYKETAYFSTDNWLDGTGYNAEELLDLILEVKKAADIYAQQIHKNKKSNFITKKINSKTFQKTKDTPKPAEKVFIACHCHAGVGRTGTFIAGFLLIDEIDRQIKEGVSLEKLNISVEKIVKQLSLQRPYMVQKPQQYVTLYRLVGVYINRLKKIQKN
jgi:protein tyrosine phosphatase